MRDQCQMTYEDMEGNIGRCGKKAGHEDGHCDEFLLATLRERDSARSQAADNDASYCIMRDEVERLRPRLQKAERMIDIARQAFTTVYNCNGAPEQWERGKRILVELLGDWDRTQAD